MLLVKNTYMHISRLLESTGLCLATKYTHLHETDQSEHGTFHLRSRPKAFYRQKDRHKPQSRQRKHLPKSENTNITKDWHNSESKKHAAGTRPNASNITSRFFPGTNNTQDKTRQQSKQTTHKKNQDTKRTNFPYFRPKYKKSLSQEDEAKGNWNRKCQRKYHGCWWRRRSDKKISHTARLLRCNKRDEREKP